MAPGFWLLCATSPAVAWVDAAWPFRRPVDVTWEAEKGTGADLAMVEVYTAGHQRPDGADVRMTTAEDRPVPSRVLMAGPGDKVRVVFSLPKGQRKYFAYFGHPSPPASRPGLDDVKPTAGLTLEMRTWAGGPVENFQQVEQAWEKNTTVLGRTVLDKAMLGVNPFGEQQQTIARMEGTLGVAADGNYTFAMSADDRAALYVDAKPVLFANSAPGDTRINATESLKKGPHRLVIYHVNAGGDLRLAVVWGIAESKRFQVIDGGVLGAIHFGRAGPMEERGKTLTADFMPEFGGECFYADGYSFRYSFAAYPPKAGAAKASFEWDFGDGQTSTSPAVHHVFLAPGVYPIKLTARVGGNADTQVTQLSVSRDWEHADKPPEDAALVHARMVETYDLSKVPGPWRIRAAWLYLRADMLPRSLAACAMVAAEPKHADAGAATTVLREVAREALIKGQPEATIKVWGEVNAGSDLQPGASAQLAELLLWRAGDYPAAIRLLQPLAGGGDARLKRLYAQALLLGGKPDEARRIFDSLPPQEPDPQKRAAVRGASARTVEYYLTQGDWEAGDDAWEQWQARDPADFLGGYAAVLKSRLLEAAKSPQAAAALAEAFAVAVPKSSYSPQLLDRAGKLLAPSDPAHSATLRKLLKERYPEDPLSQ